MKCKKALSVLLAFVMVLGLLPLSAMAVTNEETLATVTGGIYVDETAAPGKSYEYTITGTDGSEQKVTVPAAAAAETGNSITEQEVPGDVYYQKVTDPANASGEGYLLVDTATGQAVSPRPGVEDVTVVGDRINGDHATVEWKVTTSTGKIRFETGTNALTIKKNVTGSGYDGYIWDNPYQYSYSVVVQNNGQGKENDNFEPEFTGETFKIFRDNFEPPFTGSTPENYKVSVYLNIKGTKVMGDKNADHATSFTLFSRQREAAGMTYTVTTAGLEALLAEAAAKERVKYEPYTWGPFEAARTAAEKGLKKLNNPYATREEAEKALAEIDRLHRELQKAMDALVLLPAPETTVPDIAWQRTREQKDGGSRHKLVTNVPNFRGSDYQKIVWDWNRIRGLTTDPRMTVWDYNTPAQYANFNQVPGVSAATWNKSYTGDWTDSSVRKFTGTFEWPAGYTLEDKAYITSVNDANYQGIYDKIKEDPALNERFGGKKVIPVNDDMYVYVYKDGENPSTWTAEEAERHLVFWTGTTGKGCWSSSGTGNDWDRTTPAVYKNKAAVPAYYGVYPNNVDNTGNKKEIEGFNVEAMKLQHTDGWYTMVGTNTLMSTLNKLYPGEELSGTMHLDIYAFDNSDKGGMDELKIQFEKTPASTATVTINYWLNGVYDEPLGSSVMVGVPIGSTVTLSKGTADTELNHYKAAAINKAGVDVSDGKPDYYPDPGYVVKRSNNIINVIYTAKGSGGVEYYTYDFGTENRYTYAAGGSDLTGARLLDAAPGFGREATVDRDGNVSFTYTPQDAMGTPAYATLELSRGSGSFEQRICVIPASNILYEENFISGSWNHTPQSDMTVSDNSTSVYGYTDAYKVSAGANGAYTASVNEDSRTTGDLTFQFKGLGLDLIGSCGPDYGTMMVKITQNGKLIKAFVVNTRFMDEIHQVPLLHLQDLAAGTQYDVTIRGTYAAVPQPAPAKRSVMSVKGSGSGDGMTPDIYDALRDMGISDADMKKVEFVGVEDILPQAVSGGARLMMAAPAAAGGDQKLAVDSFRVYRSSRNAAAAYAENEQNRTYTNVMDEAIEGSFSAYVEPVGNPENETSFEVTTYEGKGGPENELYLDPGTGIVFGTDATEAQVSLRAVKGKTQANNTIDLAHNTEMYYEVAVENGMVTIANTGSDLLAIGNLKLNGTVTRISNAEQAVRAVAMMFSAPVDPGEPEEPEEPEVPEEPETPEVFVPEMFHAEISSGWFRKQTITVTTSLDVDKLTIDGKVVKPENQRRVNRGKDTEYIFEKSRKFRRGEPVSFEVVAYDANGTASETMQIRK